MEYKIFKSSKIALIDEEDFEYIQSVLAPNCHWTIKKNYNYVFAWTIINDIKKKKSMHRVIMKYEGNLDIDHINGNKLDNRKSNLRLVTRSFNNANSKKRLFYGGVPVSNKYKGVVRTPRGVYRCYITKNLKRIEIGIFECEVKAAMAYNKKAVELFGESAFLNKIEL